MSVLEWQQVSLDLGEFALRDVSLRVGSGDWISIVGPTGSGKTLLLEVAAGFLRPDSGNVVLRGTNATHSPPEARSLAYVPQDDLLFPHLNVEDNLRFGMRGSRARQAEACNRMANELGIAHLLHRRVDAISGGEAQRVALGRGLLFGADILLLDECTSALDEETRAETGLFLQRWKRDHELTIVQVTHDRSEAHRLGDLVVSLRDGRIETVLRSERPPLVEELPPLIVSNQKGTPDGSSILADQTSR